LHLEVLLGILDYEYFKKFQRALEYHSSIIYLALTEEDIIGIQYCMIQAASIFDRILMNTDQAVPLEHNGDILFAPFEGR
jgi:hypothetical protein